MDTDTSIRVWIGGVDDRPWYGRIDEAAVFGPALRASGIQAPFKARRPEVRAPAWDE